MLLTVTSLPALPHDSTPPPPPPRLDCVVSNTVRSAFAFASIRHSTSVGSFKSSFKTVLFLKSPIALIYD